MTSNSLLQCGDGELNARDLARLRKLEFVHNIGLIPVLRMNRGENRDADAEGNKNVRESENVSAGNEGDGRTRGQKRGFDKVEPEVSTSDTTEPEDSNDDNDNDDGGDDSSTETLVGSGNVSLQDSDLEEEKSKLPPVPVPRKSYQNLLEENEQMKKQLEENTTQISELKRLHDVITDENNLLTLELHEIQESAKEEKLKLESDLQENIKVKNILYRRVEKLKKGLREMNEILLDLINQIKGFQNSESASSSSSSPPSENPLPRSPMSPGDSPSSTSPELQLALQKWVHPSLRQHSNSEQVSPSPPTTSAPAYRDTSSKSTNIHSTPTSSSSPRRSRRPSSIAKRISRCLERIPPHVPTVTSRKSQESSKTKRFENNSKSSGTSQVKPESCKKPISNTKKALHAVDEDRQHEGFYCICGTSVTTRLGLITHIKYHTYEGQFCCSVKGCGRRYFTTSCLRAHMKTRHGLAYNGREGCRTCGATFLSRMQLYTHCKNVHKCGPLLAHRKCPDSPTTFSSSFSNEIVTPKPKSTVLTEKKKNLVVKIPIDTKHKGGPFRNLNMHQMHHELDSSKSSEERKEYFCVCGREFSSKHNLRMHIKYFTYEPRFVCKACGKRYNGTNLLRQHMKSRHGINYSGYGCRSCGNVFKTMATLYQHCRVTHNTGPFGNTNFQKRRSLIVQSVQKAATSVIAAGATGDTSSSKRQRKVPSKYIEEFEENVSTGNSSNRSMSKLNSNHPVHADDSDSTNGIKCTCGTAFTTRQALLNHIKLRTSQNIFKCSFCPCKFPRGDYLRKHVSLAHYTTTIIGGTGSSSKVSRSRSVKESFKKRSPGQVNSSFKNSSESPRHGVASSDEEKKQFVCLCGLECVRRESLREHIRLKLGLTQFKCDICNAMFWRHDYLKSHLQRVHDLLMSGYACRICGQVGFESSNAVKKHHVIFHNKENGTQDPLLTLPAEG